jgi:hypothetical protein
VVIVSFLGVKSGRVVTLNTSLPSSAVVKESIELYLYSSYGPYDLYRASVELYLYSPYGPYGLYRASVPVQ